MFVVNATFIWEFNLSHSQEHGLALVVRCNDSIETPCFLAK